MIVEKARCCITAFAGMYGAATEASKGGHGLKRNTKNMLSASRKLSCSRKWMIMPKKCPKKHKITEFALLDLQQIRQM